MRAPSSSADSLRLLGSGRADLAIVDIHDLGLAREQREDIVGVGAIVQRPLAAVIADEQIERPRELEGQRVGVTALPSDEAVLEAIVESDGGDVGAVDTITIGFAAVRDLVAGNVDAATAFWNVEGVVPAERGLATTEFRLEDSGATRYPELVLAARGETVAEDPALVVSVLGALAAGTEYALAEPAPVVEQIAEISAADEELSGPSSTRSRRRCGHRCGSSARRSRRGRTSTSASGSSSGAPRSTRPSRSSCRADGSAIYPTPGGKEQNRFELSGCGAGRGRRRRARRRGGRARRPRAP